MIFFSNLPQPFYTKILILDLTAMVILHGTVLPIVNYHRAWGTKEKFPISRRPFFSLLSTPLLFLTQAGMIVI